MVEKMRKLLFLTLLSILLVSCNKKSQAQTSTVQATITDAAAQPFSYGNYKIEYERPPAGSVGASQAPVRSDTGVPLTPAQLSISGNLDAAGAFSGIILVRNDFIFPTGTRWKFTICSKANSPCFSHVVAITTPTANLSTELSTAAGFISVITGNDLFKVSPRAYVDAEVSGHDWGSLYWNITTRRLRAFDGTSWIDVGSNILGCSGTNQILYSGTGPVFSCESDLQYDATNNFIKMGPSPPPTPVVGTDGGLALTNNYGIVARNSSNSITINLIKFNSVNEIVVGDVDTTFLTKLWGGNQIRIELPNSTNKPFIIVDDTTSSVHIGGSGASNISLLVDYFIKLGSTPPPTPIVGIDGGMALTNNFGIASRNSSNTETIFLARFSSGDEIIVGDSNTNYLGRFRAGNQLFLELPDSSNKPFIKITNSTSDVQIGSNAASVVPLKLLNGDLEILTGKSIKLWNTANSQSLTMSAFGTLASSYSFTWNITGNCSGNTNGGALTLNSSNQLVCSDDDSGAGGGGDNISVNGTAATDADFNNTTPTAPSNGFNVHWQKDALSPNNLSAYLLTTDINSTTFGNNSGTITWTFDPSGVTNPALQFTNNTITINGAGSLSTSINQFFVGDNTANFQFFFQPIGTDDPVLTVSSGEFAFTDTTSDSPRLRLSPLIGTSFYFQVIDSDDDLQIQSDTISTENVEFVNLGTGVMDVYIETSDGVLTSLKDTGHILTGTFAKARQHAATVYNDQANTYTIGAQDFGSATSLKVPTSAGASPTASGLIAYDSTSNTLEAGINGVNKTFFFTDTIATLAQLPVGTANQLYKTNAGATAIEQATLSGVASEIDVTFGVGTITIGIVDPLGIGKGGTGAATSQAAIDNISQLTTNGDLLYHNGTNSTRLARGTDGQCLTSNITTIVWGSCSGAGGGYSSISTDSGSVTKTSTENVKFAGTSGEIATVATTDDTILDIITISLPTTLSTAKTVSGGWSFTTASSTFTSDIIGDGRIHKGTIASFNADAQTFLNDARHFLTSLNDASNDNRAFSALIEDNTTADSSGAIIVSLGTHTIGNKTNIYGADLIARNIAAGTVSNLVGSQNGAYVLSGSGAVTNAWGLEGFVSLAGANNITSAGSFHALSCTDTGVGSITTCYGLKIENQTAGSINYAIFTGIGQNFFGDKLTINPGTTPVDALILDIAAIGVAGTRDSHTILLTGRSNDGTDHNIDYKCFVDVLTNAGGSALTCQARLDAASFTTIFTIDDTGNATFSGGVTATSFTTTGVNGSLDVGSASNTATSFIRIYGGDTTGETGYLLLFPTAAGTPTYLGACTTAGELGIRASAFSANCTDAEKIVLKGILTTNGDLMYHNGTIVTRIARGTNGQCLTSDATTIVWGSCGGGSAAWDTLTAPTGAVTLTMDSTAEVFTVSAEAAYISGPMILFRQQTGDVTHSGPFVSITATDTTLTQLLRVDQTGDATAQIIIDAGSTAAQETQIQFRDRDTLRWIIASDTAGAFRLWESNKTKAYLVFNFAGNNADAGAIRLQNADVIGWEANPAGIDISFTVDSSNNFVFDSAATNINFSSNPLINTVLDVEGTGNTITVVAKGNFVAAGCNNATAAPAFDLPTSNGPTANCYGTSPHRYGGLAFPDGASALTSNIHFKLPSDWTGVIDIDIVWTCGTGTCSTNNTVFTLATVCVADGEDLLNPTYNTTQTITDAGLAIAGQRNTASQTSVTTTGCAVNETMFMKIGRDPTNVSDTLAADAVILEYEVTMRRAM